MTDTQLHQAVSAASNLHALISQRILQEGDNFGFRGRDEVMAWAAACRLLSKVLNQAYDAAVDRT